ncbi:MAG: hypothetical protein KGK10_08610 [Rhodospirillales bacterium]|jgi:hypothetical protein|nr:hypothetical protein [Rhodospirillales bacterium]
MSHASGLSLLLAEEFDSPPAPEAPDLDALLAQARAQGRAETCAACSARLVESRETLASSCTALARELGQVLSALDGELAEAVRALATTLIATIGAALPLWHARSDRTAAASIAASLLAALGEEASLRLVACPGDAIELRPLLPPGIALDADAAMAPGAIRLAWRNGRAVLDPSVIWEEIEATLTSTLDQETSFTLCNDNSDSAAE